MAILICTGAVQRVAEDFNDSSFRRPAADAVLKDFNQDGQVVAGTEAVAFADENGERQPFIVRGDIACFAGRGVDAAQSGYAAFEDFDDPCFRSALAGGDEADQDGVAVTGTVEVRPAR